MGRRLLTDRERSSLTRLVLDHQARIRAFLCRFVSDLDDLDELMQEVFIGVVSRCEEMAGWSKQEAAVYLRGVARNLVRMHWRRARQHKVGQACLVQRLVQKEMSASLESEEHDTEQRLNALMAEEKQDIETKRQAFRGPPLPTGN